MLAIPRELLIHLQIQDYEALKTKLLTCEISRRAFYLNQVLIYAVKMQSALFFVRWLLTQPEIDVNFREPYQKNTAVIWAAKHNLVAYLKLLLMHQAYAQGLRDQMGFTALHYAVYNCHIESMLVLLRASLRQNNARRLLCLRSHSGHTVLQLADKSSHGPTIALVTGFKAFVTHVAFERRPYQVEPSKTLATRLSELKDPVPARYPVLQDLWSDWLTKITPFLWGRGHFQANLLEILLNDWLATQSRLPEKDTFLFLFLNKVQCQRYTSAKSQKLWLLDLASRPAPKEM